jgi:hypothetical protein
VAATAVLARLLRKAQSHQALNRLWLPDLPVTALQVCN